VGCHGRGIRAEGASSQRFRPAALLLLRQLLLPLHHQLQHLPQRLQQQQVQLLMQAPKPRTSQPRRCRHLRSS
jgi:hypothetical protein